MNDERKQDLSGPDEEALEQHVHEMLDITVPDPPKGKPAGSKIEVTAPTVKKTKTAPKKPVSITIVDHNEVVPPAPQSDTELTAAIESTNQQLVEQTATAPLVETAAKTANAKKVVVTHFDDMVAEPVTEAVAVSEDAIEPVEEGPSIPEPVDLEPIMPETEPVEAESPLEIEIESPETEKAVTDIIATESDELLVAHDKKAEVTPVKAKQKKRRIRSFFSAWFHSSAARWATFLILFAAVVGVGATPQSRYYLLNLAGVRSTASVVVSDQSTLRPLKNVTVTLAGQTAQTNAEGKAEFKELKLGPTDLVIQKRAFADQHQSVTVGWGSNPLDAVSLTPKGSQYTFTATDFLSGKPITTAEANVGESSATANEKGEITLTLDERNEQKVQVTLSAAGYRKETIDLTLSNKQDVAVTLTPSHKAVFVSKRSGKYDIYKVDVDGKNEALALAGSGNEDSEITLAPHQTEDVAALVSSRSGKHDSAGSLLRTLVVLNLTDGTTKEVAESAQVRLIDWIGTRMVYVQQQSGTEANDPQRFKLMSYDYVSGDNRQLAATNYFNDIVSAAGKIYYAPASAFQNGVNVGVFTVHADGSGKQSLLNQEAWNVLRTSYDHLTLAVQQDWYDYTLGGNQPNKLAGQPSNTATRVYADSPDAKHSVWIDNRDGKGTLVVYDTASKAESTLYAVNGLKGPARWINNTTLEFRVVTSQETADYVVSIDGGAPKKLHDVTNTNGIDRWSY